MSLTDFLPWNWFGSESRLSDRSQDLPPPVLDETAPSILRDDGFSTSTPAAATDRRQTGSGQTSNPDANQTTNAELPPTRSEPRQSPHHNLRSRANNPNAEEVRNTENNDSEYSTEADQGDQEGPRITATSARTHLRNVKHACHEEFKRIS